MAPEAAIILAGGLGTRLRPLVSDVPKPLAPVAGRPFLAWILDHLATCGVRHVVLATGYMADQVEQIVGTGWDDMRVDYSREQQPLGTGGAVRQAAAGLQGDGVHVVNGDTFLNYPPAALEVATRQAGATAGMALAHVADVGRYGAVARAGDRVTGFREKGGEGPGWINAGCYFLTRELLATLPGHGAFSLERAVLSPLAARGGIAAIEGGEPFVDIGVPEDFLRAQALFGTRP